MVPNISHILKPLDNTYTQNIKVVTSGTSRDFKQIPSSYYSLHLTKSNTSVHTKPLIHSLIHPLHSSYNRTQFKSVMIQSKINRFQLKSSISLNQPSFDQRSFNQPQFNPPLTLLI